ncbi:PucR-like helix-turn-helix protein [Oceanotoga teriensis]|uniref:PucR-like helix-turn-helix protein n=1 Tax=Oceanotoga teriensis TaxID=515440 RepID=A0AA45C6Q5_9BACT|nr:helix-turn-helix domain-containing protein [Oceanotoga teriensis]PWJ93190.1 PucR-like helix-turn-helix protein [Oceanotoga teriensis]
MTEIDYGIKDIIENFNIMNKNINEEDLKVLVHYIKETIKKDYRLVESSALLLNTLIQGKGIKYIVELGSEILNNPVILVDSAYKIIAHSKKAEIEEKFWKENIEKGYCSYEFIKEVKKIKEVKQAPNSNYPFVVTCYASPIKKMVSKVIIDHRCMGNIIVLESKKNFDEESFKLLKTLSDVISEKLDKNGNYKNLKGLMYENLFLDLLEGNIKNENILKERAMSCDFNLNKDYFIFCVQLSKIEEKNKLKNLYSFIQEKFLNFKTVYYKENFIVLIDKIDMSIIEDEDIKTILNKNNVYVGISDFFSDIINMKKYYNQSLFALKNHKNYDDNLIKYSDFKVLDLIYNIKDKINLKDFCQNSVYKLIEYDKNKNTEYFETLKSYLKNNMNMIETAKSMYLHRNTLAYRINKIKDIIDYDLNDGDKNFEIYFTIKIIEEIK